MWRWGSLWWSNRDVEHLIFYNWQCQKSKFHFKWALTLHYVRVWSCDISSCDIMTILGNWGWIGPRLLFNCILATTRVSLARGQNPFLLSFATRKVSLAYGALGHHRAILVLSSRETAIMVWSLGGSRVMSNWQSDKFASQKYVVY